MFEGDKIIATEDGCAALPDLPNLPTGKALRDHYLNTLPEGEGKILSLLFDAYPDTVGRGDLDDATGYTKSSRNTYIQRLGARGLVMTVDGGVRACADLYD